MDQYMTSVEQSLKGTETTRVLRSKGVQSIICGLSANNLEPAFLDVGADSFRLKPFRARKKSCDFFFYGCLLLKMARPPPMRLVLWKTLPDGALRAVYKFRAHHNLLHSISSIFSLTLCTHTE